MAEEYGWNVEDLILPKEIQEKAKFSDYGNGKKTVVYYPDEELRRYPHNLHYYIGNYGTVYSEYSGKKKVIFPNIDGYEVTGIQRDGKYKSYRVHRLILETFNPIENEEEMQVNHIDGNKTNNVYDPEHDRVNLEWCTCQENIQHAINHDLRFPCGENHHKAIHTEAEIWKICEYLNEGLSSQQIAKLLNKECTPSFKKLIYDIIKKESWVFISKNFPNITENLIHPYHKVNRK